MQKQMKCVVFHGKQDERVEYRDIPEPQEGEVLIKVMACGICGSDVHIYEGDQGSAAAVPPLIQGHEFAGIVDRLGKDVTSCRVGDRVVADPANNCEECFYCEAGLMSHCDHMEAIGTTRDGGFAQYCTVPARLIHHIEDSVSFQEAAMAEPLACCINGADRSDIELGDDVVIYGGGPIGLLHLQLALMKGAARVAVVEPVEEKRAMATKLGAYCTINPVKDKVQKVLQDNGIYHVKTVIETCGRKETSEEAIEIVDKHGTVIYFAVTGVNATMDLKTYMVFQKELSIKGSYCSPYGMERATHMINAHRIDVTTMVSDAIPLEELESVLKDPKKRATGKYIVLPNGESD
ncbi:MAG: zinc-dependent alcohol dehydrogenase family protein [Lachnospiraceae bacterium]|nr:zinc-dependent alcohol dehydrogenase family protein [Lachnospiraceae bacterium]